MSEPARRVLYTQGPETVGMVERLRAEDIDFGLAENALGFMALSWQVQFEEKMYVRFKVPQSSINAHFRPGSATRAAEHQERMVHATDLGSQYWLIRSDRTFEAQCTEGIPSIDEGDIVALAKVTPSRPEGTSIYDDGPFSCYVNDVLTDPRLQRRGLGSMAVHAALSGGGFNPGGKVILDGFVGNMGPNRMFSRVMGLKRRQDVKVAGFPLEGGVVMPQVRYESPPDVTLADVRRRLEKKKPVLRRAIPL